LPTFFQNILISLLDLRWNSYHLFIYILK
jgi:hypothetical protein